MQRIVRCILFNIICKKKVFADTKKLVFLHSLRFKGPKQQEEYNKLNYNY